MGKLIKGIELISEYSGKIAYYLIIPLTIVVFYTIIMRRFFGSYPEWGFEVTIFLFGIMILLIGADTLRTKGHISVDIIQSSIKGTAAKTLNIFTCLIIIGVALLLFLKGIDLSLESTMIQERSAHQTSFNPIIWWFKWFIPIGAFLLLLQSLVELLKVITKKGDENGTDI
ncbi:TRAP transporter small permease subunit [Lacicoccus alkaliphilus]|uniref:TRAP-type mannitol/chloroaromatic compound transport system, small permease component n=1 Tax=Lacicoccus alkaliphilus DSM 16010 TaxID=1123231 RepID=A0A1M7JFX3_9BACL|nr:TRAP transporter small permease [Salinicoccus alkaliphilus]SHM51980.1 TRAP-type mannitol/chloroaromatic compound transport system, small permease component [Salinicoccus alkaliphilus DSM 16010]